MVDEKSKRGVGCCLWNWLVSKIWKNGRCTLPVAILICILAALFVFTVLGALWIDSPTGEESFGIIWRLDVPSNNPDIIRVVLTAIGGLGGIVYLVIRYRERTDAEAELTRQEQETADRRLNDAIQQLGSESPQVRIAGVYAIADVADTYLGHYKQRAVDILAGYLRTDRGRKKDDIFKDAAVESTILKVFSDHLKNPNESEEKESAELWKRVIEWIKRSAEHNMVNDKEKLWCECNIDLHGAVIHEAVDFSDTSVGEMNCSNTRFFGDVDFTSTNFAGVANFKKATFQEEENSWNVNFKKATFEKEAYFPSARFNGDTNFEEVTFKKDVDFFDASFTTYVTFKKATFRERVGFSGAGFTAGADFKKATFKKEAYFPSARFNGDTNFEEVTFKKDVDFFHASFTTYVTFKKATLQESPEQCRPLTKSDLSETTTFGWSERYYFSEDSPTEDEVS